MLRLKGFKATLNFSTGKQTSSDQFDNVPVESLKGAYRANREEFFGYGSFTEPPKRITPDMVKLPPRSQPDPTLKQSKSTGNLTQPADNGNPTPAPPQANLAKSTPDVSMNPTGGPSSSETRKSTDIAKKDHKVDKKKMAEREKEQKKRVADQQKLEKKQLADQKKRDKLAAQEQAKQEKLKKEREKAEAQLQAKRDKENKRSKKGKQTPQPKPRTNPLAQANVSSPDGNASNPQGILSNPQGKVATPQANVTTPQGNVSSLHANANPKVPPQYSTNTLESSISKSSGPPPYSEVSLPVQNANDNTGNPSFGKPIDNSSNSWDLVSQHRQQMARPVTGGSKPKATVLDLQYNRPSTTNKDNSEA